MISRIGSYERILQKVKRRQMSLFGHVSRHDIMANTGLQRRVEGIKERGHPKKNWMDDVYKWTGMSTRSLLDVTKYRYSWEKLCMTPYHVTPTTTPRHA